MKKGKKVLSYVKYEKELESAYRERLSLVKRPEEVGKVFVEFALNLLSKIDPRIDKSFSDQIFFELNVGSNYRLSTFLQSLLADHLSSSDLSAILERMASTAAHRYKALTSNAERTDYFRLQERPEQR
ncbi:hypothetical protein [Pseudothermotoga thermarum]|uniref:Uncharacterized protein n=1 Tax=Pseudothermotoga thermarum DSM 5069 TaxID=688269 RepID=F7YVU1_9THEM|nr:hypothetical protein [Pseudothermotoga thermarum]AEH51763.1 hypothetical protein Theth_1718 [Pseudothermotoga thermarum DSM 5069]